MKVHFSCGERVRTRLTWGRALLLEERRRRAGRHGQLGVLPPPSDAVAEAAPSRLQHPVLTAVRRQCVFSSRFNVLCSIMK